MLNCSLYKSKFAKNQYEKFKIENFGIQGEFSQPLSDQLKDEIYFAQLGIGLYSPYKGTTLNINSSQVFNPTYTPPSSGGGTVTPPQPNTIEFVRVQFEPEDEDALIHVGEYKLVIDANKVIPTSLVITVGGTAPPDNTNGGYDDQFSYIADFKDNKVTLTFNNPAVEDQTYIINYAKIVYA